MFMKLCNIKIQVIIFIIITVIINNYPPKRRCIVVDIYRGAKRRGIYLALGTDPEGDSCFSALPVNLTSAGKSTNSRGYRELREPISAGENGYRCFW